MSITMAVKTRKRRVTPHQSPAISTLPGVVSQNGSSDRPHRSNGGERLSPLPKPEPDPDPDPNTSSMDAIRASAFEIASQPLDVWGALSAISENARNRVQGVNMLLTDDLRCIGRAVEDRHFEIDSSKVSHCHCQILRRKAVSKDVNQSSSLYEYFLMDSSKNGTFVNWKRLKRGSCNSETKLDHGDIISFGAPPHIERSFVFVFREAKKSVPLTDGGILKRKADYHSSKRKRLKDGDLDAPEAPMFLDDFRSLQRSNMELRKQLKEIENTIDTMQREKQMMLERHENEMIELKESVSKSYSDSVKGLGELLELKKKEIEEVSKISAEQKHAADHLNERLAASLQSCAEANETMKSLKATLAELKTQFDDERDQRREERAIAALDLIAAVQKVQLEGVEEITRISDACLRREREQEEAINKLQVSEEKSSLLVETLRFELENTRQKLVVSDSNICQLETLLAEEQQASSSRKSRVEELELEIQRMRKDLESEAQYSTSEQIVTNQEQLKAMQTVLENREKSRTAFSILTYTKQQAKSLD